MDDTKTIHIDANLLLPSSSTGGGGRSRTRGKTKSKSSSSSAERLKRQLLNRVRTHKNAGKNTGAGQKQNQNQNPNQNPNQNQASAKLKSAQNQPVQKKNSGANNKNIDSPAADENNTESALQFLRANKKKLASQLSAGGNGIYKSKRNSKSDQSSGGYALLQSKTTRAKHNGDIAGKRYQIDKTPWGNLKNGKKPTFRKWSKTVRSPEERSHITFKETCEFNDGGTGQLIDNSSLNSVHMTDEEMAERGLEITDVNLSLNSDSDSEISGGRGGGNVSNNIDNMNHHSDNDFKFSPALLNSPALSSSPVVSPILSPIASPVMSPVVSPTHILSPIASPVMSPIASPVMSPIASPVMFNTNVAYSVPSALTAPSALPVPPVTPVTPVTPVPILTDSQLSEPAKMLVPQKKIIKQITTKTFKVGRKKNGVSAIFRKTVKANGGKSVNHNGGNRNSSSKHVTELEARQYLCDRNIIKRGSTMPRDLILEMYRSVKHGTDVVNERDDIQVHNFTS